MSLQKISIQSLLNALPYPAVLISPERTILSVNNAAETLGILVGSFCFKNKNILPCAQINETQKCSSNAGDTKCEICPADECFSNEKTSKRIVITNEQLFEVCWSPIDENAFLYSIIEKPKDTSPHIEEHFSTAIEIAGKGLWLLDLATRKLTITPEFYTMLGYAPNEFSLSLRKFLTLVHEDDKNIVKMAARNHLSGDAPSYQIDFRCRRKDGEYAWLHYRGKAISHDVTGKPSRIIGVQSDISKTKYLQGQAIRTSQLASLGQLSASVSHEIMNPVSGVINYSQVLLNKSQLSSKDRELVSRIKKEGHRIANIANNLLGYSKYTKNKRGQHDIKELVIESLSILDISYKKAGVTIQFNWQEPLPMILCNFQQIEQVIVNILRNAYQALEANPEGERRLFISNQILELKSQKFLQLRIANNGPHIPTETLRNIMMPFFTTKSEREGTGLGLSISSEILKEHGGSLEVCSEAKGLTEMLLNFPV